MTWAEVVAELLDRTGLSVRAFARELGLSYETIRGWRDGQHEPLLALAVAVAEAVGWSLDDMACDGLPIGPVRLGPALERVHSFAASLRSVASARNLSLRQLAGQTGIPSRTLLGWATGMSEPRVGSAAKIAAALELSLDAMVAGIQPVEVR